MPLQHRHFVFLQGMPSLFFARVADLLEAQGHRITAISLCAGDTLFWGNRHTLPYRGSLAAWPAFLACFALDQQVTDLILLGEQRSYHRVAVEVAHARGISVTVTDFGYLRPDWITLERDGMSGNSCFPRNLADLARLAEGAPPVPTTALYRDSALAMALGDLRYSFSNVLLAWRYPGYRQSDRRPHPLLYFPAMGLRLLKARWGRENATRTVCERVADPAPRFIFPLQLAHDFQIVAYSNFDRLDDAIVHVIRSFAAHAEPDAQLVVKVHPWDPGLRNWRACVSRTARSCGVAARVHYVDGGDLDTLVRGARGMVTVNSTAAIRALQLGCPVVALGQAIYTLPGISHQEGLDTFWRSAVAPAVDAVDLFLRALAASIQIRGVFFSEPGLSAAVGAAAARLAAGRVGLPMCKQASGAALA